MLTCNEWEKLFCKSMFKFALIAILSELQNEGGNEDMPLALKIENHQRKRLMLGLNPDRDSE